MNKEIPLSVPNLNGAVVENLRECIETGWVSTGGRFIAEFEQKVAAYVKADGAAAVQSGTAGLHLALQVLGVKPGDGVIAPTLTFIAAVNPIKYLHAEPFLMDCDDGLCMDPIKLEKFCKQECRPAEQGLIHKATGRRIQVILLVHVFGNMANMERIMKIAGEYGLKVLEDATEALGSCCADGSYAGRYAGTIGHMGVYSFNANKIITTGGGGMIVSQDPTLLEKARYLGGTAKDDPLYFVHHEIGYNYRMLNIQAALGISQIQELDRFIQIKKANYSLYQKRLQEIPGLTLIPFSHGVQPNYWFYGLLIDEQHFGMDRDTLMHRLLGKNIQCRPIWALIHKQKPYRGAVCFEIEKAERYVRDVLNLPCSTSLAQEDVQEVCREILAKSQKKPESGGNR